MKSICKKIVAVVLAFAITVSFSGISAYAAEADYQTSANADGTVTVTKYIGTETAVTIPDTIGGAAVTAIGDSAFYGTDVASVTVPASVKSVGANAFAYCVGLTEVNYAEGSTLTSVGASAFSKCSKYSVVTLPESVTAVGNSAFSNMGKISFTTAAKDIKYADKVFDSTTVNKLSCRQGSTTDSLLKSKAKSVQYIGPYAVKQSVSVKVSATVELKIAQVEGDVTWATSDETIATVENGIVTGVDEGEATITAVNQGQTVTFKVKVVNLAVKPAYTKVSVGYTTTLKLAVPKGRESEIKWKSSNTKIATVSKKGVVKGVNVGNATIHAEYAGRKYSSVVTVRANQKKVASYSTNAAKYSSGAVGFCEVIKTSSGYTVKGHFINGSNVKAKYIKGLKVTIKAGKKVLATKTVKKLKLNAKAKKTKEITIKFTGKEVKKSVDLPKTKSVKVTRTGGKFYFTKKTTITKTVTKKVDE